MSRRSQAIKAGYRSGLEEDLAADLAQRGIKFTYEKVKVSWLDSQLRT